MFENSGISPKNKKNKKTKNKTKQKQEFQPIIFERIPISYIYIYIFSKAIKLICFHETLQMSFFFFWEEKSVF